jgi:hypothetical protein
MDDNHYSIEDNAYFPSQGEKLNAKKKPFWRRHFLKTYATIATILVIILAYVTMTNIMHSSVQSTLVSRPTPVPAVIPTQPSASPTLTSPSPETVLCNVDLSKGIDGWSGSTDWRALNNMLINDGTNSADNADSVVLAPCQLNTANYSVVATIEYLRGGNGFGILARGGGGNGYKAWIGAQGLAAIGLASQSPPDDLTGDSLVVQDNYQVDTAWHTYRFDLKENTLTFFIDGQKILNTLDNQYLNSGSVGLVVNGGSEIDVKSFQVTAL